MKREKVKEVDILRTPLDLYREYRGLSVTELAMMAHISRQTVNEACLGMKVGPDRLSRLAGALYVDVEDLDQDVMPEGMKKHMVYIPGILDTIRETIKRCPPCRLRGKAAVIAAYLAMEDEKLKDENQREVNLERVVEYLLTRCGTVGYMYLNFYLSQQHKEPEPWPQENPGDTGKDKCSLTLYREYRGMNVNQLADASGISRQTISGACSGREQLSDKSLRSLAKALCVDVEDIRWGADPRKMVHIPEEIQKIEEAVGRCRPRILEKRLGNILSFLEGWSDRDADFGRLMEIFRYLFQEDKAERQAVLRKLGEFTAMELFQVNFSRFHLPRIEIGYEESDREKGEYNAFVLFEDWVYDLFGLERPVSIVQVPSVNGTGGKEACRILDFPISYYGGTWGPEENPDEFEGGLLDQVMEYMRQCDVYPQMEELYVQFCEEFLDMAFNDSQITRIWRYDEKEGQPEFLLFIKRKADYEKVLDRAMRNVNSPEILRSVIADIFSRIVTNPETEDRILGMIGLEENQ